MLTKWKVSIIEGLTIKDLIVSYISNDEFASTNNVLKEYDYIREGIKNSWTMNKYEFTNTNTNWVYWY